MHITETIQYIGVNDHQIDLFEGQFAVPQGMAYNSYAIVDEKIAIVDAVDVGFAAQWLTQMAAVLQGRAPNYLIVQHMEPDHSGSVAAFMEAYPNAVIAASARAFEMMHAFFGEAYTARRRIVKEGVLLDLGGRKLSFIDAPMVHWPEVVMTYDAKEKALFSADAFGRFGALDAQGEWACEARRYYFGIVGKYGAQVQAVLKKISALDMEILCPLHGPVIREELAQCMKLYQIWSSYGVESEGIVIAYSTMYGHTREAVQLLAERLRARGCPKVVVNDLAHCDMTEAVEDAFRYGTLVLAATTYNGAVFPFMKSFIDHLTERGFKNRRIGLIENGSWAPVAARKMRALLEGCKNLSFAETTVSIVSALNERSRAQIDALAKELTGA